MYILSKQNHNYASTSTKGLPVENTTMSVYKNDNNIINLNPYTKDTNDHDIRKSTNHFKAIDMIRKHVGSNCNNTKK